MASLLYVIMHSTDDPDRSVTSLAAALAGQAAGHDVALWLSGEGVRLGVEGVAETLHEDVPDSAAAMLQALAAGGAVLYLDQFSFERRKYASDAVLEGAQVVESGRLGALLAEGRQSVTI